MNTRDRSNDNWWKKRSSFEKRILVALALAVAAAVILFLWPCPKPEDPRPCPRPRCPKPAPPTKAPPTPAPKETVCVTAECIHSAAEILNFINTSVDPCEDFHEFACGQFFKNIYTTGISTPIRQEINRAENQLVGMLIEPISEEDSDMLETEKRFMRACVNLTAINDDEDGTFLNLLDNLGGWPVVLEEDWDEDNFNWTETVIEARQLGLPFNWFLNFSKYEYTNYFYISYPKNVVSLNERDAQLYLDYMIDVVENFNASRDVIKDEMEEVLQFQQKLAEICESSTDGPLELVTIETLEEISPEIDWLDFIVNITDADAGNFTLDKEIVLDIRYYLPELEALLAKTPKRIQANYIMWKIVEVFAPFLSETTRRDYNEYQDRMLPNKNCREKTRIMFCFKTIISQSGPALEFQYIREYVTNQTWNLIQSMLDVIKTEFKNHIAKANWMDSITREYSTIKIDNLRAQINRGHKTFNEELFNDYSHMQGFKFSSDNIIEMITERSKADFDGIFAKIHDSPPKMERKRRLKRESDINFYYSMDRNVIGLPAPSLQGALFDLHRPQYLNFGGLGPIIGHEMSHAFGIEANTMDLGDVVVNTWGNKTLKAFKAASSCIVEDYENFDTGAYGFQLNGTSTFEENYADNVAIDIIYESYLNWVEKYGEELRLPGLDFSPNQLFWIKSSLFKCYRPTLNSQDELDKENGHAVLKYRLLAPLKNSRHFADDFNCAKGAPMNPVEKCQVL